MIDSIWKSISGMRPTSSKVVEILLYQLKDDSSKMKDRKRIILHFNPPGFY